MADFAGPRHVADVEQSVDPLFDLDEGAVVGQIADGAADQGAGRITIGHFVPGIGLGLLHAERDFLLLFIDAQDDDFDFVVDVDQLVGMADSLGPRHFADVDQPLDPFFEFDEGTVAHHVDDGSLDDRADGVLGFDRLPGAGLFCFRPRAIFSFSRSTCRIITSTSWSMLTISEGWPMRPQLMSVMCNSVDSAQVDKLAELGDVFDHAFAELAGFEGREELRFLFGPLGFDQGPAADDDIAPRVVDFEDDALDGAADVVADVGRPADIDLAGRQKDVDADVDEQAALDFANDGAGDDVVLVNGFHHLAPGFDLFGLALAEDDHAPRLFGAAKDVFDVFDQHFNDVADLGWFFPLFPLVAGDRAFAFVADVDQHGLFVDAENFAIDDLIDGEVFTSPVDLIGCGAAERGRQFLFPFLLIEVQPTNQITINHLVLICPYADARSVVQSGSPGEGSKTKRDRSKGMLPESGQSTLIDKDELGKRESVIVAVR